MVTSTGNNVVIPNIITAKVCLVGESQTGKTSLVKQLVSDGTNFPRVSSLISGPWPLMKVYRMHPWNKRERCPLKSTLKRKYLQNYLMTTAAEVSVKSINIPDTNDVVELYLVDCSGREMYMEGLASHVWSQIDMLVVVYDVTREDTFDAAQKV